MRWIIGVDLREHCQGALRWSQWVATAGGKNGDRFEAVHVLEDRDLRSLQAHVSLSEVERMARENLETVVAGSEGEGWETELVHESSAERALARRVGNDPSAVLVVGRRAPTNARGWQRLGRVARRLVRNLPAPVIVVPPDYEPTEGEPGPIVVATDLEHDSDGAATFAMYLAQRWKTKVVAVHVFSGIWDSPPGYVPPSAQQVLVEEHRSAGHRDLAIWRRRHGLADAESVVAAGDVVDQVVSVARDRKASLVVIGSRRLSLGERLYQSSVGSDTAGSSPVPVAVVPPPGD